MQIVQFPAYGNGDKQEQKKSAVSMALAKRIMGLRCVRSRAYLHQASEGGVILALSCYLSNGFAIT